MDSERPIGQFFSLVYLDRGKPADDCPRMRRRIFEHASKLLGRDKTADALRLKLGVVVYGSNLYDFYDHNKMEDILNSVTVVWREVNFYDKHKAVLWVRLVNAIFRDQNLFYEVDVEGGVHHRVDEEFSSLRRSALDGLDLPRYSAARLEFDKAYKFLSEHPPHTK